MARACPACDHPLNEHGALIGCANGWEHDDNGLAVTDGCRCDLALSDPPSETVAYANAEAQRGA